MALAKIDAQGTTSNITKSLKKYQTPEALAHLLTALINKEGLHFGTSEGTCRDLVDRIYRWA